jgi:acyl transferase domain-containing protein
VAQYLSDRHADRRALVVGSTPAIANPQLLLFSANTSNSLRGQVDSYKTYVGDHPNLIPDLAYTLAVHREWLPQRAFAICHNGELQMSSLAKTSPVPPSVTMIFSGQGAQWAGMGKNLIEAFPSFRHDLLSMDRVLHEFRRPPPWSIVGMFTLN